MYPMETLQSWAFVILLAVIVGCGVWFVFEVEKVRLLKKLAEPEDTNPNADAIEELFADSAPTPRLTLIEGSGERVPARHGHLRLLSKTAPTHGTAALRPLAVTETTRTPKPAAVPYDWATQGL